MVVTSSGFLCFIAFSAIIAFAIAEPKHLPVTDGTTPDTVLTPGASRTVDKADICNTKTGTVRDVDDALKQQVRMRYSLASKHDKWCSGTEGCEIDHLIPLTIGGANDIKNLWPQNYDRGVEWNAHVKDKLEVRMHTLICKNGADPATLQQEIASDWVAAYKKYMTK
jgi:hypothetical protein